VLLKKFLNVGFEDIGVTGRRPFGLDDLRRYPLFSPDFLDFLRRAMPPPRHDELVYGVVVTARKPREGTAPAVPSPRTKSQQEDSV
jgi:hypothetical protein